MHVIYYACPGMPPRSVVDKYERALQGLGDFRLIWIAKAGRSAVFRQEAYRLRRDGRVLPGMLRHYPPPGGSGPSTVSLVSFSAGYGLAAELLNVPEDRAALDAYVSLDSVHSGLDPDGTAHDGRLEPFASYVRRAISSKSLFWLGHADVPTPQKPYRDPATGKTVSPFASTTQCADELRRMAGEPEGNWHIRSYNLHPAHKARAEHGAALTGWGPAFVAEALVPWLLSRSTPEPVVRYPWQDPALSIGERAVEFSRAEMDRGNLETSGVNSGPRIAEYFAPATRLVNGKERQVGLRSGYWCLVGLHYAERQSLLHDERPVLPYRCAGWETQADAANAGLWRPIEGVNGPGVATYRPAVGDLCICQRGAPGGLERHGGRVETEADADGRFRTIDANKGDRWRLVDRRLSDSDILGFVEMPRAEHMPDWQQFFDAKRLSDAVIAGETGVDAALGSLWDGCG